MLFPRCQRTRQGSWLTPGKSSAPRPILTMANFKRGDVVLVDLGITAKVRPCVVVSIAKPDSQRNMSVVVPMTTQIRGGECEVPFQKPAWLKQTSVVNVLGIAGVDNSKIERRLAPFPNDRMEEVSRSLMHLLGIKSSVL